MESSFFEEARENSQVKTAIVEKYFSAWARVVIPWAKKGSNRIAYIDLFAGRGTYADGAKSTPILVLERAAQDSDLRDMLVTVFNDINADHIRSLRLAVAAVPGIGMLKHPPIILNTQVGGDLVGVFQRNHLVPTLLFADPWGYKGLSLQLIESVLRNWGSDCIVFFNYNRINMGLGNELVREHMDALFGPERAEDLRQRLSGMPPGQRELTIVEELVEALKSIGGAFVLPFRFRNEEGSRTSHHLIFVSKHVRGYQIMKDIMARESSAAQQGVPSFEYNPADRRYPVLFEYSRPLEELESLLLERFAGRRLKMVQVYAEHNVGTPFVQANYKEVLRRLEAAGRIATDPPADRRQRNTFGDNVWVAFPPRAV